MSVVVKRIDEPDFGCEGVPDNKPVCDKILFVENDIEIVMDIPEKVVWQNKIDEGMEISEELFNELKKSANK